MSEVTDYDALCAHLREWADVLKIPSGDFVNADLRRAADAIAALVARVKELEAEVKRLDGLVDAYVERGR